MWKIRHLIDARRSTCSVELNHALHALTATERGRRLLATALRPTRGDPEYNTNALVVRRILEI